MNMKFLPLYIFFTLTPTTVFAYLDPGTGSMLLQGAIGLIAAALYTLRLYWKKILDFFKKRMKNKYTSQKYTLMFFDAVDNI